MGKKGKDQRKQKKAKKRQERIRQEKHARRSGGAGPGEEWDDEGPVVDQGAERLERTVAWYRDNEAWWRAILARESRAYSS